MQGGFIKHVPSVHLELISWVVSFTVESARCLELLCLSIELTYTIVHFEYSSIVLHSTQLVFASYLQVQGSSSGHR
jgi:hypothetical protein